MEGHYVTGVLGVVTNVRDDGFYIQDPDPDRDSATSEAVFVYTSKVPDVKIGDYVLVEGLVYEYTAGGYNLGKTEIIATRYASQPGMRGSVTPTRIGPGGRMPPCAAIEDDVIGVMERNNTFDVDGDGIDFYESLEGMLVRLDNAVAVGPSFCRNRSGIWQCTVPVLSDNGNGAGLRNPRKGIVLQANDSNPERIMVVFNADMNRLMRVGDSFNGSVFGLVDYRDRSYVVELNSTPDICSGNLSMEMTDATEDDEISIATFNVHNLSPYKSDDERAKRLAMYIVTKLKEPDIITLQEIQDNSGSRHNSVVDASNTYNKLIKYIHIVGNHTYNFTDIAPEEDKDGGAPGANIRVGFLYRTDRGLSLVNRSGGSATAPTTIIRDAHNKPHLSFSPGRVDPMNLAFNDSRKPLAAEFEFRGNTIFVIANHFNSKGGDQPLYGDIQPPLRLSEYQRHRQAMVVCGFVKQILEVDPGADIVVLGDLNDYQFSRTLDMLKEGGLFNTVESLPPEDQYTYIFDGNSQALDHILVSNSIYSNRPFRTDIVHICSEFIDRASDHDPVVVRIKYDQPDR